MLETEALKVSLILSDRILAEQFRRHQSVPHKAKQVYLNTLAVSAVKTYLSHSGWLTNWEQSDSWNPIMQTLMNVADLEIPDYGKVECRAILFEESELTIPSEVQSDRIAYVAVKFKESFREAELLGWIPEATTDKVCLTQLKPISHFTDYLRQYRQLHKQSSQQSITKLSQWLEGIYNNSWESLEKVFFSQRRLSFRGCSTGEQLSKGISRVKLLNLGTDSIKQQVAVILQLLTQDSQEIDISLKVCPTNTSLYLPQGLEIMVLDENEKPILQAQANKTNEIIEFLFSGEPGEHFSIKALCNDYSFLETFII